MKLRKGLGIFDDTQFGKLPADVSAEIKALKENQQILTNTLETNTFTDEQRQELADKIFAEEKQNIEALKTDVSELQKGQVAITNTVAENLDDIIAELKYNKAVIQDPLVAAGILKLVEV
ncbi:MAG: hypothetical protein RLZZ628_377 [Bacteroidota bacterium]|jgi:acyl-CoA hydrolase